MVIKLYSTDNRLEAQAVRDTLIDAGIAAKANYGPTGGYVIELHEAADMGVLHEQLIAAEMDKTRIPTHNMRHRVWNQVGKNLRRYERDNAKAERPTTKRENKL